ncbi:uncharacterized protein LOC752232 isoform X2 [Strongylocentrotus purpuratus]|uniref:Uncharacterized protein n=1 Tax=Strongylocentrotus purpuratus TaxID=7668 RepID=A0A7M7P6B2_STRPU|nr:uncharacterized protein LOC752232 isoform X2 [Strongylocentrotus purpuratus]
MDVQLIPNEEQQVAEEAVEITQPQRPPSYTSTDAPVVRPNGPTQSQGVYTAQTQQSYIIQNIPVQQNQGCCGGRSEWFKHSVGMTTGIIQLILAIVASILSGVAIYLEFSYELYFSATGSPIGATILFFLPAGILGACSKKKNSCVIVAYLVMSILAAIHAALVCALEISLAVLSVPYVCPDYFPDYRTDLRNYGEDGIYPDSCNDVRYKGLTAIHSVIATLMFAEFVIAIVACAICCGGLSCCCARPSTQQTHYNPMVFYPQSGMQPIQAQMGAHVVQGSELPAKA